MELNSFLNRTSEWLKDTGPHSDIVLSSRIRLARNLDKLAFPHLANKKQSQQALETIKEALEGIEYLKKTVFLKLADLDSIDKQFLIERHLMSLEHAQKTDHKAVVIDEE